MFYRRFGRTELQMPVFSCGGMRYQQKWEDIPLSEVEEENQKNLNETILRAVELGINHIETARGYGSSERQLGVILPTLPRDKMIIQTKVAPFEDPNEFRKNFEDSFNRLNLEYVDLLGIHGINTEELLEWTVKDGGCLEVAREFVEEGKVRHVGFSTHAPTDTIIKAIQTDKFGGFDYVNLHWYYIFQKNWQAVLEANKQDMGVFIISPSDKGGKLYEPPEKLVELTQPLHPMEFNDLFCLIRTEVHTLSIGAARPSDFDIHVDSLKKFDQAEELIPPIIERLEKEMVDKIGKDFLQKYEAGLPDWPDVPQNINLKIVLWLYNMARAWDMVEYGALRYNLLGNGGHWFPGENLSKLEGADLTPALKDSPYAKEIPAMLDHAHELMFREPEKRLSESD